MQPSITDLFGELVITLADIDRWILNVPHHIEPHSRHAAWYVTSWAVPDKIRRAKLDGSFDRLPREERHQPWWWPDRYRAALEKPLPIIEPVKTRPAPKSGTPGRPRIDYFERVLVVGY